MMKTQFAIHCTLFIKNICANYKHLTSVLFFIKEADTIDLSERRLRFIKF